MTDVKQETDNQETLSQEILTLYDDFSEFHDQCSFLCDAFASITAQDETLDSYSAQGLGRSACWMKLRVREFRKRLHEIQGGISN